MDPQSAEDLFQLAKRLHMRQGTSEVRAAEVLYRRCLRLSPTHVGALSNYGLLHQHALHNLDAAESLYARAEELNATSTIIQHNLAVLANFRGRYDEAEERFKRVLSQDSDYAPSLFYYATFLAQTRDAYDSAEGYYRRALQNAPGRVDMMCPFALFLRTQGKDAEARQVFQEAQRVAPSHPRVRALETVMSMYEAVGPREGIGEQRDVPGAAARADTQAQADDALRRRSAADAAAAATAAAAAVAAGRRREEGHWSDERQQLLAQGMAAAASAAARADAGGGAGGATSEGKRIEGGEGKRRVGGEKQTSEGAEERADSASAEHEGPDPPPLEAASHGSVSSDDEGGWGVPPFPGPFPGRQPPNSGEHGRGAGAEGGGGLGGEGGEGDPDGLWEAVRHQLDHGLSAQEKAQFVHRLREQEEARVERVRDS